MLARRCLEEMPLCGIPLYNILFAGGTLLPKERLRRKESPKGSFGPDTGTGIVRGRSMKISIESDLAFPAISKEISIITDGAVVFTKDIKYNKGKKTIQIRLQRRKIKGFKERVFSDESKPLYDWHTLIDAVVVINGVQEYEFLSPGVDLGLSSFTILFGIQVEQGEIFISSMEESEGKALFQLKIKIQTVDLQIYDLQ
jgi:hypothetical protein